jgi:hypothetical protein
VNTKITLYRGRLGNGRGPWWSYEIKCGRQYLGTSGSWTTKTEAAEAAEELVCSIYAHCTHLVAALESKKDAKSMKKKKRGGC